MPLQMGYSAALLAMPCILQTKFWKVDTLSHSLLQTMTKKLKHCTCAGCSDFDARPIMLLLQINAVNYSIHAIACANPTARAEDSTHSAKDLKR
jgi:hypothetical protein